MLNVPADADAAAIRQAFHRAVLLCHPDCCQGDEEEVKRRFGRVVAAYRQLRERLIREDRDDGDEPPVSDQFDPADFARMVIGWETRDAADPVSAAKLEWLPRVVHQKVAEPAVDETRVFVLCWLASIVLALAAGAAAATLFSSGAGEGGAVLAVLVMAGTYVGAFVVSLLAIVGSRRTAWLLRVIGFRKQRALPAPKKGRRLPEQK